jgi:hypothetical protein
LWSRVYGTSVTTINRRFLIKEKPDKNRTRNQIYFETF